MNNDIIEIAQKNSRVIGFRVSLGLPGNKLKFRKIVQFKKLRLPVPTKKPVEFAPFPPPLKILI